MSGDSEVGSCGRDIDMVYLYIIYIVKYIKYKMKYIIYWFILYIILYFTSGPLGDLISHGDDSSSLIPA